MSHWHCDIILVHCSCVCKITQSWHSLMNIIHDKIDIKVQYYPWLWLSSTWFFPEGCMNIIVCIKIVCIFNPQSHWSQIITLQCCILAHTTVFSSVYVRFRPPVHQISTHCMSLCGPVAMPRNEHTPKLAAVLQIKFTNVFSCWKSLTHFLTPDLH